MSKKLPKIEEQFLPLLMSLKDGRKCLSFGSSPVSAIEKALEWSEKGLVRLDEEGYVEITSFGLEVLDQQYNYAVKHFETASPIASEDVSPLDKELSLEERLFQRLVDLWHVSDSNLKLHEFCGLTQEEYAKLVEKKL